MAEAGNPEVPILFARSKVIGNVEASLSRVMDASFCDDWGAVLFRGEHYWQCLDPGEPGQVLTTNGPGAGLTWSSGAGVTTPAFTAFSITGQSTSIEVGATIAAGSKTFTWTTSNSESILPNSISITDSTASVVLASGLANDETEDIVIDAITNTIATTQDWTIAALNNSSISFSRTFIVSWLWRIYAGTNAAETLTANQIKALADFSSLKQGFPGDYTVIGASAVYYYFCYPDEMGSVSTFFDGNTGFAISMATVADNAAYSNTANGWSYAIVSVTNAQSVATNYRVYRTQYPFSGTLLMRIT